MEQLTVRHGDLHSGRMAVVKQSSFMNSRVAEMSVRFFIEIHQPDVVCKGVQCVSRNPSFVIGHSGRESHGL
jgi:hypothetical protein